ncbi:hypothetical protein LEMLEM_LOCUS10206, partial [Lemmus lemmus]
MESGEIQTAAREIRCEECILFNSLDKTLRSWKHLVQTATNSSTKSWQSGEALEMCHRMTSSMFKVSQGEYHEATSTGQAFREHLPKQNSGKELWRQIR